MGYYLEPGAELPEEVECQFFIFKPLVNKCAYDSRYNSGGINVGVMPNLTTNGTAETDVLANRFVLASTPLTRIEDSVVAEVKSGRGGNESES